MSFTIPNAIMLKGPAVQNEAVTAAGVYPGMLVQGTSTGTIQPHNKAAGHAEKAFALEDAYGGGFGLNATGVSKDTVYATGVKARYAIFSPGGEVLAKLASGQNVAKNAALVSNGDGYLTAEGGTDSGGTPKEIIGYAAEAVDNSGGAAPWIPVRIK